MGLEREQKPQAAEYSNENSNVKDTIGQRSRRRRHGNSARDNWQDKDAGSGSTFIGWERDWPTLAAELCSVDDGLSVELDGFKLSKSKHREEQLKAYGNAIVPQVAMEIMRGMTV